MSEQPLFDMLRDLALARATVGALLAWIDGIEAADDGAGVSLASVLLEPDERQALTDALAVLHDFDARVRDATYRAAWDKDEPNGGTP
jgi:hypothetical protein